MDKEVQFIIHLYLAFWDDYAILIIGKVALVMYGWQTVLYNPHSNYLIRLLWTISSQEKGLRDMNLGRKVIAIFCVTVLLAVLLCSCAKNDNAYLSAVEAGYSGTAEEFAAALVGECADNAGASAYELAFENGYSENLEAWMKLLTGVASHDPNKATYDVAVENGYEGSLAQWVTSLVPEPDAMGLSKEGEAHTEYEIACVYGFEGTFIEWLVSLI
jgi:hypothetical protein